MPWPNFTELTFGMAFLREFEREYVIGGKFPKAPDFISQAQEGTTDGGYDVEAAIDGATPMFLQFKRSFVVKGKNAKEFYPTRHFASAPVYRMNLYKKNSYQQHFALRKHAKENLNVFYVTSQIQSSAALNKAYLDDNVVSKATAMFSPLEIDLPDKSGDHHVSFRADEDFGFVFSSEGRRFRRKFPQIDFSMSQMFEKRQTREQNRQDMQLFCDGILEKLPPKRNLRLFADRYSDPIIKASILAYFTLDAQLTFVTMPNMETPPV